MDTFISQDETYECTKSSLALWELLEWLEVAAGTSALELVDSSLVDFCRVSSEGLSSTPSKVIYFARLGRACGIGGPLIFLLEDMMRVSSNTTWVDGGLGCCATSLLRTGCYWAWRSSDGLPCIWLSQYRTADSCVYVLMDGEQEVFWKGWKKVAKMRLWQSSGVNNWKQASFWGFVGADNQMARQILIWIRLEFYNQSPTSIWSFRIRSLS